MSLRDKTWSRKVPRFEPESLPDPFEGPLQGSDYDGPYDETSADFLEEIEAERAACSPTFPSMVEKATQVRQDARLEAYRVRDEPTKNDLQAYLEQYMGDEVFAARFTDCIDMLRSKNKDYSQGEQKGDRIAAFRRIARDVDITMKQAWAVFCQKHWGAVMKFVKEGTVESEPIDGRINDIINYMVLFGAIVDDERSTK